MYVCDASMYTVTGQSSMSVVLKTTFVQKEDSWSKSALIRVKITERVPGAESGVILYSGK